jgi:adenylate cyclase
LYVAGLSVTQLAGLVAELRESPVLTISNIDGFASAGGMTQFFFEHGQLRFRIHLESAKRAGLQISSRLLIMARPQ